MILRGAWKPSWTPWLASDALWSDLDDLERQVEKVILEGKVVVVNCNLLGKNAQETRLIERAGVVSLRWGAPRLLLVTPEQSRALDRREELCRNWRLWRYQFDPGHDAWVQGSPVKAEALIRRNIEAGLPWMDGLLIDPAQTGQGTKP